MPFTLLISIAPEINQSLFQFINAMDVSGKHAPAWLPMSDSELG